MQALSRCPQHTSEKKKLRYVNIAIVERLKTYVKELRADPLKVGKVGLTIDVKVFNQKMSLQSGSLHEFRWMARRESSYINGSMLGTCIP